MSAWKCVLFRVVSSGRDEYPADGLRLQQLGETFDKRFLDAMGVQVQAEDEIEVAVRIISRVVTERKPA